VGEVERGHVAIYRAIVMSQGGADRTHEWELTGAISTLTALSATGLLKAGFDETAPELTLTATSIFDTTKTASATATVIDSTTYAIDQLPDLKEDKVNKGALNGYAPLGVDGKVPEPYLPDSDVHFLGIFPSLTQLQNAYPSPVSGDYAFVIVSSVQTLYIWDGAQWVDAGGSIPSGTFVETVNRDRRLISTT
jgi:hypothetical protein